MFHSINYVLLLLLFLATLCIYAPTRAFGACELVWSSAILFYFFDLKGLLCGLDKIVRKRNSFRFIYQWTSNFVYSCKNSTRNFASLQKTYTIHDLVAIAQIVTLVFSRSQSTRL